MSADAINTKYDVAISFLYGDLALASALNEKLANGLSVFFYPGEQEDLAGSNGLESMKAAFAEESRFSVILYREGWGKTPWTRVEELAIQERCLKHGWDSVFLLVVDAGSKPPKWFPGTNIWLNLEAFGIEQAVGAIKNHAVRCGAQISVPTVKDKARATQRETERVILEKQCFSDTRWISQTAASAIDAICTRCKATADELNAEGGMSWRSYKHGTTFVITKDQLSLLFSWTRTYTNVMAPVRIATFIGEITQPGRQAVYTLWGEPQELAHFDLHAKVTVDGGLLWIDARKSNSLLTEENVADIVLTEFLNLLDKLNTGEVNPRKFFEDEFEGTILRKRRRSL